MANLKVPSFLFTSTGAAAWGLLEGFMIPAFNSSSISSDNHWRLWNTKFHTPSLMGRLCFGYNLHLTKGVMVAVFSSLKTMLGNLAKRASLFSSNILLGVLLGSGCARYTDRKSVV